VDGAVVIEDAAQSLGGSVDGEPMGSLGDVAIVSFGHTKLLDLGGGGALVTDDAGIASASRRLVDSLPERPHDLSRIAQLYRSTYYALWDLAQRDERIHDLFLPIPEVFRDLYVHAAAPDAASSVFAALGRIEGEVDARRRRADRYRAALDVDPLVVAPPTAGDAPWRFSFLVPEDRQAAVLTALREAGLDASSWYPALPRWYEAGRRQLAAGRRFPNAFAIERRVVNLWVDDTATDDRIDAAIQIVLRTI
jgi:dTDP-4-amino-4,6-dideoxygalactose transaminase